MAETIIIEKNLSDEEIYKSLLPQLKSLLKREDNYLSILANVTAVLKEAFEKISWVGFYLFDGKKLFLGPFQGKVACTEISIGKGVCGTAAQKMETIIVQNVHKFEGHIACDPASKSEIVLPLIKDGKLLGVLDIDSAEFNSFNINDKKYLEEICSYIVSVIS